MQAAPHSASFLRATVGRKVMVALFGLFLYIFMIEHLMGNLLLLVDPTGVAFNEYSHNMVNNPLIRIIEVVLFVSLFGHIGLTIYLNRLNNAARPVKYHVSKPAKQVSIFSRTMIWSGLLILAFLVIHLYSFFYPYRILNTGATPHELVLAKFSNPLFVWFYVLTFVVLCGHMIHGFGSGLQTLGLKMNPGFAKRVNLFGTVLSIVLCLGYIIIPLYILYFRG